MKLPTLYKRTSTGAIEQWTIRIEPADRASIHDDPDRPYDIVTEHGQLGGKLVTSCETVTEGKNLGKKNATTAQQQAEAQAKSEWNTKLTRKGYVEELARAQAGENNGAGGIRPMLAKSFDDHGHKLKYPCYAQPKLDGIRCIAVVGDGGKVTLWTREQKPIVAVPRIAEMVEAMKLPVGTVLDGELYNHALKDDFEQIASCVRKQYEASPEEQALIQYHVYDLPRHAGLPADAHFGDRATMLSLFPWGNTVVHVETRLIRTPALLQDYRQLCQRNGYEGAMARGLAPYEEGKRSAQLLKMKEFLEGEFEIAGVYEGVGKMAGLGLFCCSMEPVTRYLTPEEARAAVDACKYPYFGCKLEGELEGLRKYLQDESTWKGKKLTVKYFSFTNKNKVPRFPVGKSIRDYE